MSIESRSTPETEEDRQRVLEEIEADSDADWEANYAPGTLGCHELLDRTSLLMDMVESQLASHPACAMRPEWFALAQQASAALFELYQQVGAEHLSVKTDGGEDNGE